MKINLYGYTARQYAVLILREDMGLTFGQIGIKMNKSYRACRQIYVRAKIKETNLKNETNQRQSYSITKVRC